MENNQSNAGVIAFPPVIYGATLLATLLADRILSKQRLAPPLRLASIGCFAGAALLIVPSFGELAKADTPVDPYAETKALVRSGPFRYTRNPIYAGLTLAYAGAALAAGSRFSLRLLPAILWIMRVGVIEREERYLEQKFGDSYRAYKNDVPRWF